MTFKHKKYPFNINLQELYNDQGRFYKVPGGNIYPSVTTILGSEKSESLEKWKENVGEEEANRISKLRARQGDLFHKAVEYYLKNDDRWFTNFSPIISNMVRTAKKDLDKIQTVYALEQALYSNKLRVAGRLDCWSNFDIYSKAIVDFKSSSSDPNYNEEKLKKYFCQLACYATMIQELTGIVVHKGVLIFGGNYAQSISRDLTDYKDMFVEIRERSNLEWQTLLQT